MDLGQIIQDILADPAALGQIILFDLILSGDNAVVIGVVASRLHGDQRRWAIVIGAGGAVVLRIALASIATLLLLAAGHFDGRGSGLVLGRLAAAQAGRRRISRVRPPRSGRPFA